MSTEDRSPAAPGVAGATFSEFTGEKMRPLTEEQISELETKEEQEMQRRLAAMKIKHQHEYKPAIAGGDKSAKLYTGAEIPFVGLGTWCINSRGHVYHDMLAGAYDSNPVSLACEPALPSRASLPLACTRSGALRRKRCSREAK